MIEFAVEALGHAQPDIESLLLTSSMRIRRKK